MFPASFGYVAARSVEEALELMVKHGEDGKLLAGGHSLIPAMKLRLQSPRTLIDLGTVPGLRGVRQEGAELVMGALTVHADVASSELVRKHLPGLAEAASVIGDLQVRNRGTIGGSVAHADPAADLPVILTALDASFAVRSPTASRTIAVDDFFTDFYTTAMNSACGHGERLCEIAASCFRLRRRQRRRIDHAPSVRHLRVRAHCHQRIEQRPGPRGRHRDRIAGQTAHPTDDHRGGRQGG